MAKARMISKDACDDVKLNRLSIESQLLYLLTLPHLDRDGLVDGRPSWLAGHCLTERMELHTRIGSFVEEWVVHGLVTRYQGNNGAVLFFHGFRKHNPNLIYEREQESKFPPPPGFHRGDAGLIPDDPEVAGRLMENFDIRSRYRVALTEAAKGIVDLAESLGLAEEDISEHKKIMTSSRPDHDQITAKRREVEVKDQEKEKGREESNGAEAPAPTSSKEHPLIRAFHELHNRYPNKAQMAAIIEHDPPIADWERAIRAWGLAGHNPTNIQGMLDWAFDPSRAIPTLSAARVPSGCDREPIGRGQRARSGRGGARRELGDDRKTGYSDYLCVVPPPDEDKLPWRAEMTRAKLAEVTP